MSNTNAPSPDVAGLIEAAQRLVDAVGAMRVPQNTAGAGMQIMVTLGPILEETRAALSRLTPPEQDDAHPDDHAVDRFAAAMKAKLAEKRNEGRGGWEDKTACTAEFLSELLRGHVDKGDPLDVGNLAMMLHQRGERIEPKQDDAIRWAEGLIRQLPATHEGRNSWLLNYGTGPHDWPAPKPLEYGTPSSWQPSLTVEEIPADDARESTVGAEAVRYTPAPSAVTGMRKLDAGGWVMFKDPSHAE